MRANNCDLTVLQGNAGMSLRYCGMCNDHFVENVVLCLAMKEFRQ